MDECTSEARFSALVSGTAADHMTRSSHINAEKIRFANAGAHEASSKLQFAQQQPRSTGNMRSSGHVNAGRTSLLPGDLVRRAHRSDVGARPSMVDAGRFSSPMSQMDMEETEGAQEEQAISRGGGMAPRNAQPQHEPNVARPNSFVKLRTSKSFHQRSGLEDSRSEHTSSAQSFFHAGPRATTYDTHQQARSRSASVASSVFAHTVQEEDISSIMMRGANDLRNAKHEIEELRRQSAFLSSQVETAKSEKDELLNRLKTVKETAKQGLETTSRSLSGVRACLDGLKSQSEESFAIAAQAKAALPDVQELRQTVAEAIKGLELVMNEDGQLAEVTKTKEVINELKIECMGSKEVIEMLREKLQSVGSDLIDAKTRVSELEGMQAADRDALRVSGIKLSDTSGQIGRMVDELKRSQTKLNEALSAAADYEGKLASADLRVAELTELVEKKDIALAQLSEVQSDYGKLQVVLHEREAQIQELKSLEDRINELNKEATEYVAKIRAMAANISARDDSLVDVERRLAEKESELHEVQDALQVLKQDHSAVRAREDSLLKEIASKDERMREISLQLEAAHNSHEDTKKDLELRNERIRELQTKFEVMEERFDTQVITAKCAQETQAVLQERLVESQAKFERDLAAANGKHNTEIGILLEQKTALLAKQDDLEAAARSLREEIQAIKAECDGRMAQQEGAHRVQMDLAEKRVNDLHAALEDARVTVKNNEELLASSKQDILALREELRDARLPSPAHKEAVDALGAQIAALRLENTELMLRARSIGSRYRARDLNEEEKVFINTLVEDTQAAHEHAMVSKGNELKRRDNLIAELKEKIQTLESTVAKNLKLQSKLQAQVATENRSLIDPATWSASSAKTSSVPPMADEDMPCTNVDNTVTAKPTPAPIRPAARLPLAAVPQPDPNSTKTHATRPPARLNRPTGAPTAKSSPAAAKKLVVSPTHFSSSPLVYPDPKTPGPGMRAPAPAQKKPNPTAQAKPGPRAMFSRLATDCSDEIADFEEPRSGKGSPIDTTTPPQANRPEQVARPSKTALGKRDKPAAGSGQEGEQNTMRKRLRVTRSRAVLQDEPAGKETNFTQIKYKSRKHRAT